MIHPHFGHVDDSYSGLLIERHGIRSKGVNLNGGPEFGSMIITHYQRYAYYIIPDVDDVMKGGRIT